MKEFGTYHSYSVRPNFDYNGCVASYSRTLESTRPYEREWGHSRELTVEIGDRPLKPGQVENLTVCQTGEIDAEVDVSKMAFEYAVLKENTSNFWKKATKFTLTPGATKQAAAAVKNLGDAIKGLSKSVLHNCNFYNDQSSCQSAGGCHWSGSWDGSSGSCEELAQNCDWYNDQGSCQSAGCHWHEDFYSRGCD